MAVRGMGVSAMAVTGMRVTSVPVPLGTVAVTRVRRLCETAQRHDAETNTPERQTERVGVHGWLRARLRAKRE